MSAYLSSPRNRRAFASLALLLAALLPARAAPGDCVFTKRPPTTLKNMGPCEFDPEKLSFKGTAAEQAACLARPVLPGGAIDKEPGKLPEDFLARVGTTKDLPALSDLMTYLLAVGFARELAFGLPLPISRANSNDADAPSARYFVIHDTSAPNFRQKPFPEFADWDHGINNLNRYRCANAIEPAHFFINRRGEILKGHDFLVPWRATKFEGATNFGTRLRGLFVHTELIQPRRAMPGRGWLNDFLAPTPGFSRAQYDRLALVYIVASRRAGEWMIPAFHAVIDDGIYDKHDDPQNFEFAKFNDAINRLLNRIPHGRETTRNFVP